MKIASHNTQDNILDALMPAFGIAAPRARRLPIWNEGQKMFILDEQEGRTGGMRYKGLRFCESMAIVETVGTYGSMTYIGAVAVYVLHGTERRLIEQRKYSKTRYSADFIKSEAIDIVAKYLADYERRTGKPMGDVMARATRLVGRSYTSPLDDSYLPILQNMLPLIASHADDED